MIVLRSLIRVHDIPGNISTDVRPLDNSEFSVLQANMVCLRTLINTVDKDFLTQLEYKKVITLWHRVRISGAVIDDRNYKLLTIMERRSFEHLKNFKQCLRVTLQPHIIQALEKSRIVIILYSILLMLLPVMQ